MTNEKKANNVKDIREKLLMSKAELARKAGLSALTIDRVEQGMNCRMETKRKIILALGLRLTDKEKVFSHSNDEIEEGGKGEEGSDKGRVEEAAEARQEAVEARREEVVTKKR